MFFSKSITSLIGKDKVVELEGRGGGGSSDVEISSN